jgi:hypothetical protein
VRSPFSLCVSVSMLIVAGQRALCVCLCAPPFLSFSMVFVSYQRKIGD